MNSHQKNYSVFTSTEENCVESKEGYVPMSEELIEFNGKGLYHRPAFCGNA
jgi:hypothetical protein